MWNFCWFISVISSAFLANAVEQRTNSWVDHMAFLHNTASFLRSPKEPGFHCSKPAGVSALSSLLYRVRSLVNRKWISPIKYSLLFIVSLQKGQCRVSLVTEYSREHRSNSRVSICSMFRSDPVSPLVVSGPLCLGLNSFQLFPPDIFKGTACTPYWWYLKAGWKTSSM